MKYEYKPSAASTCKLELSGSGLKVTVGRKGRKTDDSFISFKEVTEVTLYRSDMGATVCRLKHTGARKPLLITSHSINEAKTAFERSPDFDGFLTELHRKLSLAGGAAVFYDGLPWLRRFIRGTYFFMLLFSSFAVPFLLYLTIDNPKGHSFDTTDLIFHYVCVGCLLLVWLRLLVVFPRVLKSRAVRRYAPDTVPSEHLSQDASAPRAEQGDELSRR
jgi:hypothetical protein